MTLRALSTPAYYLQSCTQTNTCATRMLHQHCLHVAVCLKPAYVATIHAPLLNKWRRCWSRGQPEQGTHRYMYVTTCCHWLWTILNVAHQLIKPFFATFLAIDSRPDSRLTRFSSHFLLACCTHIVTTNRLLREKVICYQLEFGK